MIDYNLWFTRMIHTSWYRKQLRKEKRMGDKQTPKQFYVVQLLDCDVNMPTKDIILNYNLEHKDSISERHVQRIRKWYKTNLLTITGDKAYKSLKGETDMNQDEDIFDATDGLHEWELDIINLANEGGWSIQQLANRVNIDLEGVKQTITKNSHFISESILDQENPDVYSDVYFLFKDGDNLPEVTETEEQEQANLDGNDDYWEVEIDCASACSKAEQEIDVFLNRQTREKAMKFMKWAKAREWLAYLVGNKQDDGYHIEDLYLPDQRASQALVDKVVAEQYNHLTVVGVIHSHHEMGAGDEDRPSFSGHDANFINGNHNLSLLAGRDRKSKGFKIVGIARVMTPCGARMQVKANVKPESEKMDETEKSLFQDFMGKVFNKENGKQSGEIVEKNLLEKNSWEFMGKKHESYHFVNKNEMDI